MKPDTRPIIQELAVFDVGPDDTRFDYGNTPWRWAYPYEEIHEGMQVLESGGRWVFSSRVGYSQSPYRLYRTLAPFPDGQRQGDSPWAVAPLAVRPFPAQPPLRVRYAYEAASADDVYFEEDPRSSTRDDPSVTRHIQRPVDSGWVETYPTYRIGLPLFTTAPLPVPPFSWDGGAHPQPLDSFGQLPFPPVGHRYAGPQEVQAYLAGGMTESLRVRLRVLYPDSGRYEGVRHGSESIRVPEYPLLVVDDRPLHKQSEYVRQSS